MSNDYAGLGIAIGEVTGLRVWELETDGTLSGITRKGEWNDGRNIAKCEAHGIPTGERTDEYKEADWARKSELDREWKKSHSMEGCEHGFYGMFADEDPPTSWRSVPLVFGVIAGSGETLIGTKGFRAMEARILAICLEPINGMWDLNPFFIERVKQHYPSAEIFMSKRAMLGNHPLTTADEVQQEIAVPDTAEGL